MADRQLYGRIEALHTRMLRADPKSDPRFIVFVDETGRGAFTVYDKNSPTGRTTVLIRDADIPDAITRIYQQIEAADARRRDSAAVGGFARRVSA